MVRFLMPKSHTCRLFGAFLTLQNSHFSSFPAWLWGKFEKCQNFGDLEIEKPVIKKF